MGNTSSHQKQNSQKNQKQKQNKKKNQNKNQNAQQKEKFLNKDNSRQRYTGWTPGNTNKSPNDPDFTWYHHTPQGRRVLSEMSDAFYMD